MNCHCDYALAERENLSTVVDLAKMTATRRRRGLMIRSGPVYRSGRDQQVEG
jgi:hypothetical protein